MQWDELVTQAKAEGYSSVVIPADEYEAEVVSAKFQKTSGKKDNIWVKYRVLSGPYKGEVVSDNMYIDLSNPKLMGVFRSKLIGAGASEDRVSALSKESGGLNDEFFKGVCAIMPGLQSVIKVSVETYKGKPGNKVFPQHGITTQEGRSDVEVAGEIPNPYNAPAVNPQMPI